MVIILDSLSVELGSRSAVSGGQCRSGYGTRAALADLTNFVERPLGNLPRHSDGKHKGPGSLLAKAGPLILLEGETYSWYSRHMKKTDTFTDRRQEAEAARIRRLEKFKERADQGDPEVAARAIARQEENAARAERKAAVDLEKKRTADRIRVETDAAAEARRLTEDEELKKAAAAAEAQSLLDEASRKAKRDERYANRKARA